ncbi:hypothetical protein FCM35_KLT02198 [Carex littledalei]|uniref:Uncharacterized protein n=1 Tax=Carex littledalei TaxID=544730 RepID=A0A833VBL9_9POAL|nr:hypothetical protein FCM35_KLT02198 [Carex littledalei]
MEAQSAQGDYIQLHEKRYGKRLDHDERQRKRKAREVKKRSRVAQQVRPVAEEEVFKVIRTGKRKISPENHRSMSVSSGPRDPS